MKKTELPLEVMFEALADRTRLRLLNLLQGGEVCVCFFVEVLDEPQPKISRHLAFLRRAGLVASRRQAKWMHYSIVWPSKEEVRVLLQSVLTLLAEAPEMRKDQAALTRACCSSRAPALLKRAPKPDFIQQGG